MKYGNYALDVSLLADAEEEDDTDDDDSEDDSESLLDDAS